MSANYVWGGGRCMKGGVSWGFTSRLTDGAMAAVDKRGGLGLFARVLLLRKITAFLLVALWLPTAQHCMLEAAGLLSAQEGHAEHSQCCESTDGVCDAGACNLLEGGDYRPSAAQIAAPVPNFTVCTWMAWVQPQAFLIETDVEADTARASFERPPDCSPTWQFVQRTALSPRAPSLVAA